MAGKIVINGKYYELKDLLKLKKNISGGGMKEGFGIKDKLSLVLRDEFNNIKQREGEYNEKEK